MSAYEDDKMSEDTTSMSNSDDEKTVCGDQSDGGIFESSSTETLDEISIVDISINILNDEGIDMAAEFPSSSTVEEILKTVENQSFDDYDLEYNGQILPRNKALCDIGINKNDNVKVVERKTKIFVKDDRNGYKNAVDIQLSATVKDLKEKLRNSYQNTEQNLRITYNGSELADSKTLRSYNIQKNSELVTTSRCYGG
ncbi:polyubiquitin-like [Chironomus tepperi]|uniref:polyubiquitin-like n=1 Tax=Chironomus tepperi TaxID=113505 RepID=UPI00391F8DC9